MSVIIRKVDGIRADLPGKRIIGPCWITFNTACPWKERGEHLSFLKNHLAEFVNYPKKVVFLSDDFEKDLVTTIDGDEEVAISTIFVTVDGMSIEKINILNKLLQNLFSIHEAGTGSAVKELSEPE